MKRIQSHKGVVGTIVVNSEGNLSFYYWHILYLLYSGFMNVNKEWMNEWMNGLLVIWHQFPECFYKYTFVRGLVYNVSYRFNYKTFLILRPWKAVPWMLRMMAAVAFHSVITVPLQPYPACVSWSTVSVTNKGYLMVIIINMLWT
jgi:hypothetical protein